MEDARLTVRKTNEKLVNDAINRYYKEHMAYPKYQWLLDSFEDIENNENRGLDTVLCNYFVNKKISEILLDGSGSRGNIVYFRVTEPLKKASETAIQDNSFDSGTWKMAKNLRLADRDFLVHEIKIVESDERIGAGTFSAGERFTFPLIDNSTPINDGSTGQEIIEEDNKFEIEMVCCPPGTFLMGAPMDEHGRKNNETPHTVTLTKQFLIGKYEITQKQYLKVMGTNPSNNKKSEDHPVENVTLQNALDFCEKLNTDYSRLVPYGYKFDLPTEAQWEYACRAGTTKALNNNKDCVTTNNYENIREVAWFNNNSNFNTDDNKKQSHPVGQKLANNWGLYDMHGNVEEMIKDLRHKDYPPYPAEDAVDPLMTREMISGSDSVVQRCHRGGSYEATYDRCRSASRQGSAWKSASKSVGFRVVLVPIGD